jgi:hypothetical protein
VNVRAGPGTGYAVIGQLTQGQTATVIGKSADGQWWQIKSNGNVVWIFAELVQANAVAASVAVIEAPPLPTAFPTPEATPTTPAVVAVTPISTTTSTISATTPAEAAEVCDPNNPYWAARLNDNPLYTFCTPVPFEFVPAASADPDEMVIRWHIFGIQSLELRVDPSGDSCGTGSSGMRQQVAFKEDNFRLNRRSFPQGGYKIGLWATLADGHVQHWGELHFCGKA